jgi:serine/threonine protein kinase
MRFVAPEGTEMVAPLPAGSVFQVARVRHRGAVAVCKRLLPRVRHEAAARAALVREATALARARHPSLPELRDVGSDAHGPFVIEGFVEGASVREVIEGWRARGKEVPPSLVAHLALTAAEALAELHELAVEGAPLGLSHGDLGPDHLLLGPLGAVSFVDFGAARCAGMEGALDTGDQGTLPFVAPEVARGEVPPGQSADVYALAATLLFLAAGGAPFTAARDDAAMLLEIGERGIAPALCDRALGLFPAGREALRRALALDPSRRPASARELFAALHEGAGAARGAGL